MKTNPRLLEQQLAWRSLIMVALPALILFPLLAILKRPCHAEALAKAEPLFTMAAEPSSHAEEKPLLIPAAPTAELPDLYFVPCTQLYIPPTPQPLQPIACSFEPFPPDDSDLTVTNLPEPPCHAEAIAAAEPRPAATPQIVPSTSYIVHSPRPPYPPALLRRRISGSVGVHIHVSPQGLPTAVDITRPSGHSEFDTTTRSWILRHWRFQPATAAGVFTTTVHFRLQ